jgi:hypothetical protein
MPFIAVFLNKEASEMFYQHIVLTSERSPFLAQIRPT